MKSIPQIEQEILKFWKEKNIFKRSLEKSSPKGDFIFYEGPPTANGKPGVHHVLSRAYKDVIPRYKTMQGYRVKRKAGWDTHGLPVEIEVEKRLGLKGKKGIEEYGIARFNEECKKSVWQYKDEWERFTERLAFWLDLANPYITYSREYIETLWWIIKRVWEQGLLVEGFKVVPHCPRCETALSSHEVALGYKAITEKSLIVKFKLKDVSRLFPEPLEGPTFILSWTTTPWTLPGNVALAVKGDIDYAVVATPYSRQDGEYYILAKDLVNSVIEGPFEVVAEFKGKDLVDLEYEPLYDSLADVQGKQHYVVDADFVSIEEGTGVVHTAVMYGEDDYLLGEREGLPKVHTVNEDGTFNERVPLWKGRFVKDAEPSMVEDLKKRGLLYKEFDYEHDYPFCWRCSTPLLYYAKPSWFVKMSSLREQLIRSNQSIHWVPDSIKEGRFGEWLKEVKDWAFSRERYWGTPLPVWVCQTGKSEIRNPKSETPPEADQPLAENSKSQIQNECKNIRVIGSIKELEELSGKILEDLHKPFIDEVEFPCEKCGGIMKRVPEVCDVWFDSGAMPFAQVHFPFDQAKALGVDVNQVDERAFEQLIQSIDFPADYISEAIDQTRGWFYTLLAVSTLLERGAPFKNVICLGHVLDKDGQKMSKSKGNVIDPWEMMESWGADPLRYYLFTMNDAGLPKRFDVQALKDVSGIFHTLMNVVSFYKLFSDDGRHNELVGSDFVHVLDQWVIAKLNMLIRKTTDYLEAYDVTSAARGIGAFITDLSLWYVRRSRERFKNEDVLTRTRAGRVLGHVLKILANLMAPFTPFFAEQAYQDVGGDGESVHLQQWPTPQYGDQLNTEETLGVMIKVREVVSQAHEQRAAKGIPVRQPLQKLRIMNYELGIMGEEYQELIRDEVNVKAIELVEGKGEMTVELDTIMSEELKKEGLVREITRLVNDLRKKQGLTIQDRVVVVYDGDEEIKKVIEECREQLAKATLAKEWKKGETQGQVKVGLKNATLKVSLILSS